MKTSSDELFQLIKSLSVPEKVYFKVKARQKEKNNSYLILFDAVNSLTEYDEALLLDALKGNKSITKNLKRIKNYTIEAILKYLGEYHSNASIESQIRNFIHQIEILSQKKNFKIAEKILSKAESLAKENELYEYLLILSHLKIEIGYKSGDTEKIESYLLNDTSNEYHYINQIKNVLQYSELRHRAYLNYLKFGFKGNLEVLKSISYSPLLFSPEKAKTFLSNYYYHHIHYLCSIGLDKLNYEACRVQEKWIETIENNPLRMLRRPDIYLSSLTRVMILQVHCGKGIEAEETLSKGIVFFNALPEKLKTKTSSFEVSRLAVNFLHVQLVLFNPEKAINAWVDLISTVPVIKYSKDFEINSLKYINLFRCYFLVSDFEKALNYLNKGIIHKKNLQRMDIQKALRFYLLMVHYELGDFYYMSYLSDTLSRWLVSNKLQGTYEKKIISFFKFQAGKSIEKAYEIKQLKKFKNEIELIPRLNNDFILDYLLSWLASKINNKPLLQVLKEDEVVVPK